ncbi:MAG: hypothetical protein AAF757_18545 [Cyanobacteria bacterium P01_D01_bin.116]
MKYTNVSCVITPDSYTGMRTLAKARGTKMSVLIREAIKFYLVDNADELAGAVDEGKTLAAVQ